MKSSGLSISLIVLGLVILGLVAIAHFGPIDIPGGPYVIEIKAEGSLVPTAIIGALLLIIGVAIESHSQGKK